MAFFEAAEVTSKRPSNSLIPKCGACGLHQNCRSPKMSVSGGGRQGVLIVAEAPGEIEDERGQQLVGPSGQLLRESLSAIGFDLDRDCWKTASLICKTPGERSPTSKEVDYCRPNLTNAITKLQPRVIIPLGVNAIRSVIGPYWRDDPGSESQWVGWRIPLQKLNAWICPNYDLKYVLDSKDDKEGAVVRLWFNRYLKSAFNFISRPYDVVPDYTKQIRIELDVERAATWIREKISQGGPCSFDYETNRLKSDWSNSEVVCASICWRGKETIAYPLVGAAIEATREFLVSGLPKIGANSKFETRWSRKFFGVDVKNWVWDDMLSAHHLDCRSGITSVKFQAFVRLGVSDWSASIKGYLESAKSDGTNRVREVPLRNLLLYCGLDSLFEFLIAEQQKKEMKVGFEW